MQEIRNQAQANLASDRLPSVEITFSNLIYKADRNQKLILNNLSGHFKAGQLSAIMGPSGSGKTSLLNTLAGRINSQNLTGNLTANGHPFRFQNFGYFANYVMQKDILISTLTVRQTLKFAADLKLDVSQEEKEAKIMFLATKLKIEQCLDVMVGGNLVKGISGGEMKRVSIAFELISNPAVLVLDQPTSGLDSLTSFIIVEYLKNLANVQGKTVILTIHQPNAEIFVMFDQLLLMSNGHIVYQGPNTQTLRYFSEHFQLRCPQFYNPADFLMGVLHKGSQQNSQSGPQFLQVYKNKVQHQIQAQIQDKHKSQLSARKVSLSNWSSFKILLNRDYLSVKRNPLLTKMRFLSAVLLGIIAASLFFRLSGDYSDRLNWAATIGQCYIYPVGAFLLSFTPLALAFPLQRTVFLKQQSSKLYTTFIYFMSRSIIDLPYTIIVSIILSLQVYWIVGLSINPSQFFIFMLVAIAQSFAGSSMGLLLGSIITDAKSVGPIIPLIFEPCMLFAGYFKNLINLPTWIGWFQYLSPFKYGFTALVQNQVKFANAPFLQYLNFNTSLWSSIGVLFALGLGFRVLSLFFLWKLRAKVQ